MGGRRPAGRQGRRTPPRRRGRRSRVGSAVSRHDLARDEGPGARRAPRRRTMECQRFLATAFLTGAFFAGAFLTAAFLTGAFLAGAAALRAGAAFLTAAALGAGGHTPAESFGAVLGAITASLKAFSGVM